MSSDFDVMVAGHICLDIRPDLSSAERKPFEDIFLPGHLVSCGPVMYSTGGAVANTGLALDRLGVKTRLVAKVGDDLFGKAICQALASHGENLLDGMATDATNKTSYTIIISYPGVDRIFLHYPGANDTFQASDVPYTLLRQARLFHFGYPPVMRSTYEDGGAQLEEIFRRARDTDVTTSLDMAFPDPSSAAGQADWRSILKSVLPFVDIFFPSVEEILFMLRNGIYQELLRSANSADILPLITPELLSDLGRELIGMGAKIVGLKLGYRGLYLRTGCQEQLTLLGRARPAVVEAWAGKELWAPCFKVDVVGTTGAGDATIAGFLGSLLRDMPLETGISLAVAVGACNVEAADALRGIRSWDATIARVASGWKRQDLQLNNSGWLFDPKNGLWHGPCD